MFAVVAAPELAIVPSSAQDDSVSTPALVAALMTHLVVLVSGLLVHLRQRIETEPARYRNAERWIVAGLTLAGVYGVAWVSIGLSDESGRVTTSLGPVATGLVLALSLFGIVLAAHRPLRWDPMAVGITAGLVLGAVQSVTWRLAPSATLTGTEQLALTLAALMIYLALAFALLELVEVPLWVRSRLALAVVLFSVGDAVATLAGSAWVATIPLLLSPLATALLCCTCLAWLRQGMAALEDSVEDAQARLRADRARIHEINGTIAGIASASRLLQDPGVPTFRSGQLRRMMSSEVERLERLLREQPPQRPRAVELDRALADLVTAQRLLGRVVEWSPSGQVVCGRPDDIVEVLHILLENAAQHAPRTVTTIRVARVGPTVRVAVSDAGPGVDPDVRPRIFDWEVKGRRSRGQGIGLALARSLVQEQGGSIELDESASGATFVVDLPAATRS